MGICKDRLLTYLNRYGYNVVQVPRAGIEPLDVLGHDESLEKLGTISEVWTSTEPVPAPGAPAPVADLGGQKSDNLDLGLGLKILANALAGMGAAVGLPTLNLAYKRARSLEFKFTNVASVQVHPFAIGKYLAAGVLDVANPFVARYFGNEETDEYIISEVLKSDSVSVTARSQGGADIKLEIPAIQAAVGVNVAVAAGRASAGELIYAGKVDLTFGFKAYQVFFENGKWLVRGVKPSGDLAFETREADEDPGAPVLLGRGGMLRLKR
jgi:hypothetical protein